MTKTYLTLISLLMAWSQAANAQSTAKSTTADCPRPGIARKQQLLPQTAQTTQRQREKAATRVFLYAT